MPIQRKAGGDVTFGDLKLHDTEAQILVVKTSGFLVWLKEGQPSLDSTLTQRIDLSQQATNTLVFYSISTHRVSHSVTRLGKQTEPRSTPTSQHVSTSQSSYLFAPVAPSTDYLKLIAESRI